MLIHKSFYENANLLQQKVVNKAKIASFDEF